MPVGQGPTRLAILRPSPLLLHQVPPSMTLGASVGIYTLLASLKAGLSGIVYAFEPLPRNLRYLHQHVAMNHLKNCSILEAAVSDTNGTQRFSAASWDYLKGRLSPDGEVEVHGSQQHSECRELLAAKGYRLKKEYGRITATFEP